MSIGLTPKEMREIVPFVQFAVTASYLGPMVFWSEAPVLPIMRFAAAIVLFVALTYFIGGKRLLQCDLNETLRNDALI